MPIAIDFGTCNTVIARWNETRGAVEQIRLDKISRRFPFTLPGQSTAKEAWVIPSLIHYGESESCSIGEQVAAAGLANERATFQWVKLEMLRNNTKSRKINGRLISYPDAAAELLKRMLLFTKGSIGGQDEDLIITVPVEAFDHYIDWIRETAAGIFHRDIRVIDEATACIFGYQDRVGDGEVHMIVDFGGGTLDVAIVKTEISTQGQPRCLLLGRAGEEIGGSVVDKWLLEELAQTAGLSKEDLADLGAALLADAERVKIELSSGAEQADILRLNDLSGRLVSHGFSRAVLQRLLRERGLYKILVRTVARALEEALVKYGLRSSELGGVFLVGGSSLLLGVVEAVANHLPDCPLHCDNPFEAIAVGACRVVGEDDLIPNLVHDYCVRGWNRQTKTFELIPVVKKGLQYPTNGPVAARYLNGAAEGATCLGLVIYEQSQSSGVGTRVWVDGSGRIQIVAEGETGFERVRALNPEDRQFITVDPPCRLEEKQRFIVRFGVDSSKRLCIDLEDTRSGSRSFITTRSGEELPLPVRNFPIVKL